MTWLLRLVPYLVLASGLTWLLIRGAGPDEAAFAAMQSSLDRFTLEEAALRRDVLRARDGLLKNYDPIVAETEALKQISHHLQAEFAGLPVEHGEAEQLAATLARQEDLAEAFKTTNAQLQNSLTYFDTLSFSLGKSAADPALAPRIGELGSAVLHMTRDPSADVVAMVQRRLDALAVLTDRLEQSDTKDALAVLARHGRLLTQLMPAMDLGVGELFAMRPDETLNRLQAQVETWRRTETRIARRYDIALYLTALLLLVVLVRAAWQLRAGARALQRRAALEHRIAGVSTRFIGCPPDQVGAQLEHALALLGPDFGADRAYLLLADASLGVPQWTAPGMAAASADWLAAALQFAPDADEPPGATWHYETSALPQGPLRSVLERAPVTAWAGVVLQHGGRRLGLLAMDRARKPAGWPFGGLGLLRMAGEVLANALYSRAAAQERSELQTRLHRARRLETVGTFASGIAHNFNNIIAAVVGHAEMASDRLEPNDPAALHVHEIHRAGERARELVGRILDVGVARSNRREPIAVDALLAETVSMLSVALPPGVDLEIGPASSGWVAGDPVQLQQVLANLIRNAGVAIRPPGRIWVCAGLRKINAPVHLSHGSLPPGDYVRIEIADTGVGMDEATQAQIFNPFFTTREAGTGLGLNTAQAIIADHGGAVHVQSEPGVGSCFSVWLSALPSAAVPDGTAWHGCGQTVLVFSPNEETVLRDEETLAALGFEPVGFSRLELALSACRSGPSRFDAMLVDVSAGERNRGAITALQAACPGCPIIAAVSATAEAWSGDAFAANKTLRRPLRSALLSAALANCLSAGQRR